MTRYKAPIARAPERGFVLVSVIWAVAIASIVIAFASVQIDRGLTKTLTEKERFQAELDALATEQTLLYLLATREKNFAGLDIDRKHTKIDKRDPFSRESYIVGENTLRFDQTLYAGIGECLFSVQDAANLFSLRSKNLEGVRSLLLHLGKSKVEAKRMLALLQDYTDRDSSARLSGAEYPDYPLGEKEYFPRNRYLNNPGELKNLVFWKSFLSDFQFATALRELSIYSGELLNFNLMTPTRIGIVSGSQRVINDVLEHRKTNTFATKDEVKKLTGIVDQDILSRLSFYPSKHTITRTFCQKNLGENIQSVSLTPDSNFAPWELDYYLNLAKSHIPNENLDRENPENSSRAPKRYPLFSE
ncbi:MAG: hypothetical protein ACJ0Q2_04130 [Candidatus Azotimanducaceae bacterium]